MSLAETIKKPNTLKNLEKVLVVGLTVSALVAVPVGIYTGIRAHDFTSPEYPEIMRVGASILAGYAGFCVLVGIPTLAAWLRLGGYNERNVSITSHPPLRK